MGYAQVFPTPVGMNRVRISKFMKKVSVPHARGDEPRSARLTSHPCLCSPRPWG